MFLEDAEPSGDVEVWTAPGWSPGCLRQAVGREVLAVDREPKVGEQIAGIAAQDMLQDLLERVEREGRVTAHDREGEAAGLVDPSGTGVSAEQLAHECADHQHETPETSSVANACFRLWARLELTTRSSASVAPSNSSSELVRPRSVRRPA